MKKEKWIPRYEDADGNVFEGHWEPVQDENQSVEFSDFLESGRRLMARDDS